MEDLSIENAVESLRRLALLAKSDTRKPAYHFSPPAGWMNDLNGGLEHGGWYHMFYLHDPFDARGVSRTPSLEERLGVPAGGLKRPVRFWGHARSRDLVRWENLPPAIGPSREAGELKPISGSSIVTRSGQVAIVYTSVDFSGRHSQAVAFAEADLVRWHKPALNRVLELGSHEGPLFRSDWRDPFAFEAEGRVFMIVGARVEGDETDAVLPIFEAEDGSMLRWRYRGIMFRKPLVELPFFECPKLFRLRDRWVLVTSPFGPVRYFAGSFDPERARFVEEHEGTVDYSEQHYASENVVDGEGHAWLMGWLPGWAPAGHDGVGWNGCMSLPRLLDLDADRRLIQVPAPQLAELRGERLRVPELRVVDGVRSIERISGDTMEIACTLRLVRGARGGLRVRSSSEGRAGVDIGIEQRQRDTFGVAVDRFGVPSHVVPADGLVDFRIFLDRDFVEVFVAGGERA